MDQIIVESPYAGDLDRNESYLNECLLYCLARGYSPYASHGLLTRALDDCDPKQRALGIAANLAMRKTIKKVIYFVDYGISNGMGKALINDMANPDIDLFFCSLKDADLMAIFSRKLPDGF